MSITQMILKVLRFIEIGYILVLVSSAIQSLCSIAKKEPYITTTPLFLWSQCIFLMKALLPALWWSPAPPVSLTAYDWITWGLIFFCIVVCDIADKKYSNSVGMLCVEFILLKFFNLIGSYKLTLFGVLFMCAQGLFYIIVDKGNQNDRSVPQ